MADNIVLAQILSGIAALRLKKDFDTVIKEAKTRKKEVCPYVVLATLLRRRSLSHRVIQRR